MTFYTCCRFSYYWAVETFEDLQFFWHGLKYTFLHSLKNNTQETLKNSLNMKMCYTILILIFLLQHKCDDGTQVFDFADQRILHSSLLCNIRNCNYHCFYSINEFDELLQKPTFVHETKRVLFLIRKYMKKIFKNVFLRKIRDFLGFAENRTFCGIAENKREKIWQVQFEHSCRIQIPILYSALLTSQCQIKVPLKCRIGTISSSSLKAQ